MEGPETDIYVFAAYFDKSASPHGIFTGQKIRQYPIGFGTTTMMKTTYKPELVEMSVEFLKKLGYQGLCDVEFKYDRRDDTYKIIEINPRLGR
jgi:D-aspartate ligase